MIVTSHGVSAFAADITVSEVFSWNVNAYVGSSIDLTWNVNNNILYYYQVEGECLPQASCSDTGVDPQDSSCGEGISGQQSLLTLSATSLSELANKIKTSSANKWPIKSIKKFSRPVRTTDIAADEARGIDHSCNKLEEIDGFCRMPEFKDLCFPSSDILVAYIGMSVVEIVVTEFVETPIVSVLSVETSAEPTSSVSVPITISQPNINVSCGCNPIPPFIYTTNNLFSNNALADFMKRNKKTIPSNANLRFNSFDNTWRNSYSFFGIGENDAPETWRVIYEWACENEVAGESYSNFIWKYSLFVKRSTSLGDLETRILYVFSTDPICQGNNKSLNFSFLADTANNGSATTSPGTAVSMTTFYDRIGLFSSYFWQKRPLLSVVVSAFQTQNKTTVLDISSIFPPQSQLLPA